MQKIKTSDDLCAMVNEELMSRSRDQQLQLRRSRRSPQYAPFRSPRIYREDYARDVLGVNIPLNESYPWSLKTRLLIEEAEGGIIDWFGGAVDWLFGLPGKILGVLTAFKDLVLNPGAIRALAKQERVKWQKMLQLIDRQFRGKYENIKVRIIDALDAAISKVEGEKGLTAACGTVALSLVVRYRGFDLLKLFGRAKDAESITRTENYDRYISLGLGSLLEGRVVMTAKGKARIRQIDAENADALIGYIENFIDNDVYQPPGTYDSQSEYEANAMKSLLKQGKSSGDKMTDTINGELSSLFKRIWGDYEGNKDNSVDPIVQGKAKSFDTPIAKAAESFVRQLQEVASGKPQESLSNMWSFLGKIGSSASEGIGLLWALVKKYGKTKKVKEGTPGGVAGPDAAKAISKKYLSQIATPNAMTASLKNNSRILQRNPYLTAVYQKRFGKEKINVDKAQENIDQINDDLAKLFPKISEEVHLKIGAAKNYDEQLKIISSVIEKA